MPTRIEDILVKSRTLLADKLPNGRWTDGELISFLDEGYTEAVVTNKLLKDRQEFFIADDVRFINLPDEILLPTRVTYNGNKISFLDHQDFDQQHEEHHPTRFWECDEGAEPRALVFDLQNRRRGTIYPILRNITKDDYTFVPDTLGVLLTIGSVGSTSDFGVLVTTEDTVKSDGFVVPVFGVAVAADDRGVLEIYYDKKPGNLVDIDSVIEIDTVFDIALKYYVIHMALAADQDTMDNRMSEKYLNMYVAKIAKAKKDASNGYKVNEHHTDYKGFV